MSEDASGRIDKWLWYARFVRTRTLAQKLVQSGAVRVNRAAVRSPSHAVKVGDAITMALRSRIMVVRVAGFGVRRAGPGEAQALYETIVDSAKKDLGLPDEPPPA